MEFWLEHCEPPRPRPPGIEWDVFISYRSLDRAWAIALYDMLTQRGYKIFVDQFVLVPGQGLASQLGEHLQRSNSGVLIWSERTQSSKWVENEYNAMFACKTESEDGPNPFHFVVAAVDHTRVPALAGGSIHLDFSDYPDGPMGADLARLTAALQGNPLSPNAVMRVVAWERELKKEPVELRALAKSGDFDAIVARIKGQGLAYNTHATVSGIAVDQLIRGKQYLLAIDGAQVALTRFPSSVRLRQLYALALRRNGQIKEASFLLNVLVEEGHKDPETLGMLGAVYADQWEDLLKTGKVDEARDKLEQSRNLYRDAFRKVPTDTYVGINAASKSALLGDLENAQTIAKAVLALVAEARQKRRGEPATDYWDKVTEPEALLLLGQGEQALELYHEARIAHQSELGSIASTATQVSRLLSALELSEPIRSKLKAEFSL